MKALISRFRIRLLGVLAAALCIGLFGMPAAAGAATSSTTISSTISAVISAFTSGPTVNVNVTPSGVGLQTIASDTVTVSTNDTAGYTLLIADSDATNTLVSGANSIAANTGNQTTPVAETANTWGYRVDGVGGFGAGPTSSASNAAISAIKFAPVPVFGSPNTLKTTASTASNDTTTVWYGVAVSTTKPSGTYTDTVTYTATAN